MTAGIVGAGAGASTISKKSIYNRVSPARLACDHMGNMRPYA